MLASAERKKGKNGFGGRASHLDGVVWMTPGAPSPLFRALQQELTTGRHGVSHAAFATDLNKALPAKRAPAAYQTGFSMCRVRAPRRQTVRNSLNNQLLSLHGDRASAGVACLLHSHTRRLPLRSFYAPLAVIRSIPSIAPSPEKGPACEDVQKSARSFSILPSLPNYRSGMWFVPDSRGGRRAIARQHAGTIGRRCD